MAVGWLAVAPPAHAECKTAYTNAQFSQDLGQLTVALRNLDEPTFKKVAATLESNIQCIRQPAAPQILAAAYRYIGVYRYLDGDEKDARRWFLTALEIEPTYEWDVTELPENHPIRKIFDEERDAAGAPAVAIEGMQLKQMAGASIQLDGRAWDKASATTGRPHLFMIVSSSDHSIRQAVLIDGNQFPKQYVEPIPPPTPDVAAETARNDKKSKKKKGEAATDETAEKSDQLTVDQIVGVEQVQRIRPAAKTPLMITGLVGALAGGGLYAATFATHSKFDQATTTTDLEHYQALTNALVAASGITFGVSVGVGYAGVMMSGGPGMFLGGHF
jgi:hypothetical protein